MPLTKEQREEVLRNVTPQVLKNAVPSVVDEIRQDAVRGIEKKHSAELDELKQQLKKAESELTDLKEAEQRRKMQQELRQKLHEKLKEANIPDAIGTEARITRALELALSRDEDKAREQILDEFVKDWQEFAEMNVQRGRSTRESTNGKEPVGAEQHESVMKDEQVIETFKSQG